MLMDCVHYVSSCILAGKKHIVLRSPRKLLTALAFLPGVGLSYYIRHRALAG